MSNGSQQQTPDDVVQALVEGVLRRAEELNSTSDAPLAEGAELRRTAFAAVLDSLRVPKADRYAWADGKDVFGLAYERLLNGGDRRAAGQVQTPFWAADVMASWLFRKQRDKRPDERNPTLLDPGVGAGRLLFRAGIRDDAPSGLNMVGLDLDPLALSMAHHNLRLRDLRKYDLRSGDFFEPTSLDGVKPSMVIANPPYSRRSAIPTEVRERLHAGFEERLGVRFDGLAGLAPLFLARALELAPEGAHLAFITPAEWLDTRSGQSIRRWVLDHAEVEGLVLFPPDALIFGDPGSDDVLTTAAITLLRRTDKPDRLRGTPVVTLPSTTRPGPDDVARALVGDASPVKIRPVVLSRVARWARPTTRARRRPVGSKPLREFATVQRGIATGHNGFFVISEAARRAAKLDIEHLRPALASPRLLPPPPVLAGSQPTWTSEQQNALADSQPRWALDVRDPDADVRKDALGRYLRRGKKAGVPERYLAANRQPWYGLESRGPCAVLVGYFQRGAPASRPRFVRNTSGAVALNTMLVIEPRDGVDADDLVAALNRPSTLRGLDELVRAYGGGMWKLEPRELGSLAVKV